MIRPRWRRAMAWAIGSPNPVPPDWRDRLASLRETRSKISSCLPARIPGRWLDLYWRRPLRRADLPTSLPLLGPEPDRFLAGDLLAALEQRHLAGDQFAAGELQGLGVTALANRIEVQHLAAIAEPALLE